MHHCVDCDSICSETSLILGTTLKEEPLNLRIESLKVENFRAVKSAQLAFDERLTVLIGNNGAGKTSVLDALAYIISNALRIYPKIGHLNPNWLNKFDVSIGSAKCELEMKFRPTENGSRSVLVTQSIGDTPRRLACFEPNLDRPNILNSTIGKDLEFPPVVVYYRQSRGFEALGAQVTFQTAEQVLKNSTSPDLGAIRNLQSWWDDLDADEAREVRDSGNLDFRNPQLEAVRKIITEIETFAGISYSASAEPKGLYLKKSDGTSVHVDKLSSGERSYIVLLADLARRLQTVAPDKDLHEIAGIVLIDEIELNLHPAWQGKIIKTLTEVFRNCQFIVTTHSPNVLSGIEASHVRVMKPLGEGRVIFDKPQNTKGRTADFLLEGVFGATERALGADTLVRDFNNAVDAGDVSTASDLLAKLSISIEGDAPELMVFRKRLERLKRRDEGQ